MKHVVVGGINNSVATQLNLDPETEIMLGDVVASGRFTSPEDAVREGLRLVLEQRGSDEINSLEPLTPEELAGIKRGLADVEAGRVYPAKQVFAELRHRYENWPPDQLLRGSAS